MSFIPNTGKMKKLVLLFVCREFRFPLTEEQFLRIIFDNQWMSYFEFKEYISYLIAIQQIKLSENAGLFVYNITDEGKNILKTFEKEIPISLQEAFFKYVNDNKHLIRKQTLLTSEYKFLPNNEIEVSCIARDKDNKLMSVSVFTDDETQAKKICQCWEDSSPIIYEVIMNTLISNIK